MNKQCSNCKRKQIEGIRYFCLECSNFILCSDCEKKVGFSHGHSLLKIRNDNQLKMYLENNQRFKATNNKQKNFRDDLERQVKEIKMDYDILFKESSIRNALIRTQGNKENAVRILKTELNRQNFYNK